MLRLAELERRFDGPIPPFELEAALAGNAAVAARSAALAQARFFTRLMRECKAGRSSGSREAELQFYADRRRLCLAAARAQRIRKREAPPTEGGASIDGSSHHPILDRV
jgi:hypothetical protein